MTDIFTLLRKNSTGILFVIYLYSRYIYFEKDIITYTSILIFTSLTLLIYFFSKTENKFTYKVSFVLLSILLIYYDSFIMPDIIKYFRSTYLVITFISIALIFNFKIPAFKFIGPFLGINLLFIIFLYSIREKNPLFTQEKFPDNPVFKKVVKSIDENKNVLIILLDGYPSKRVFLKYNGISTGLDSILSNYQYQEFNSKYISTPLSITNILFGAEYPKDVIWFKNGQDEIKLFNETLHHSSLDDRLKTYDSKWISFLQSKEYTDHLSHSPWRINYFRSADRIFTKKFLQLLGFNISENDYFNNKILEYNTKALMEFKSYIENPKKPQFIFLHYLTFHRILPIETLYTYADSLLNETIKNVPDNYNVIVFSDHGLRKNHILDDDKNSGILYTNIDDSTITSISK